MCRETILRYNSPAENFNEALPIGNGRIGAMIYGDTAFEKIPLNEDSVWSGGLRHRVNPDAAEGLEEVRSLIKKGNIPEAERIAFEKLQGVTPNMRRYMPLGDLHIDMELHGRARNYSRKLDIGNAVSEVTFTVNDILFRKEYFISAPDEVMAVRISSAERGMISLSAYLDGREDYYDDNRPCAENMLLFTGGSGSRDGIFFAAVLGAKAKGGSIRTLGGRIAVEKADEEAYFFRLSEYGQKLLDLYEEHPEFLEPESRRNEMKAFINQGLEDLCISRTSFDWGIPVPIDEKHVIYVWLDALSNYVTALGYPDEPELYEKYWPADVHLVGKEIVRFHSVIWPAMLMSIEEPLPKQVRGHGWLLIDGGKMSKSKGNVVDPVVLIERYGIDALKYFLLREYTFGQDGVFTNEVMLRRMNFDLANDLGNLVSRTVSMIEKYCDGIVPDASSDDEFSNDLKAIAVNAADKVSEQMDKFAYNMALEEIWILVRRANKFVDEKEPWVLAKDPERKEELDACMNYLAEALRIVSVLIHPFMHTTAEKMRVQLGLNPEVVWEDAYSFNGSEGCKVEKGEVLFPRLDIEKELAALEELKEQAK